MRLAVLVLGVALAGWLIGRVLPEDAPARPAARPAPSPEAGALRQELTELRREVAALRERESTPEKTTGKAPPAASGKTGKKYPTVADAARELAVSNEALRAVVQTHDLLSTNQEAGAELENLAQYRGEGFRAVVALLRAGKSGTWLRYLFEATWKPGEERHLLELLARDDLHPWSRHSALAALGSFDTPEVRAYLVETATQSDEPGVVNSTAESLARLREPGAAEAMVTKIHGKNWSGVNSGIVYYIGEMGGDAALRALLAVLADQRTTAQLASSAVGVLQRVDPEGAARHVARVLAEEKALGSPHVESLFRLLEKAPKELAKEALVAYMKKPVVPRADLAAGHLFRIDPDLARVLAAEVLDGPTKLGKRQIAFLERVAGRRH